MVIGQLGSREPVPGSPARVALIGLGAAHGLVEAGRRAPGRGLEVGDECVARTKEEVVLLHLQ